MVGRAPRGERNEYPMSLINEALKKAQAQRSSSMPPSDAPPGEPPLQSNANTSSGPTIWLVAALISGIALVFVVGAGLIVWGLMGSNETAPDPQIVDASEDIPEPAAAAPEVADAGAVPPIEPDEPTETVATGSNDEAPSPAQETGSQPPPLAPVVSNSDASEPPNDAPVPPSPRFEPDPAVQAYLATLEVRGVMSGGQKALIFNHSTQRSQAYASGATISNELQIKIQDITERSISFVDHDGYVYTKSF